MAAGLFAALLMGSGCATSAGAKGAATATASPPSEPEKKSATSGDDAVAWAAVTSGEAPPAPKAPPPQAPHDPAPAPDAAPEKPANEEGGAGPFTIAAVGDIMMGTTFPHPTNHLPKDGAAKLLEPIQKWLKGDIVFGNLEGPLIDGGETRKCGPGQNCYAFRSPETYSTLR